MSRRKHTAELATPVTIRALTEELIDMEAAGAPRDAELTIGRKRDGSAVLITAEWDHERAREELLAQDRRAVVPGPPDPPEGLEGQRVG